MMSFKVWKNDTTHKSMLENDKWFVRHDTPEWSIFERKQESVFICKTNKDG